MGMFDWVDYECVCPQCNNKVRGFQTKDGDCTLDTVKHTDVENFYSTCNTCKCWIEFTEEKIPTGKHIRRVIGENHEILSTKKLKIPS